MVGRASIVFCLVCVLAIAVIAGAQGKDITLSGKVTCAKCELKVAKDCATVIVVKENGKDVVYYLDDKAGKENHDAVCAAGKDGSVTGKTSEKDGKKYITASKVEFKK